MLSRHLLRLLFHFCNFDLSKWGPARNQDCYFTLSNAPEPGELPTYQIPNKVRDVLFWTSKELLPQATPVSAAKALLEDSLLNISLIHVVALHAPFQRFELRF